MLLEKYTLEDCLVLKEKKQNKTDQQNRLLPYKCRGYSQNDCTPFMFWVPIIKDVPKDSGVGGDAGAGAGGRDPQVEHGLAAQELADAGAQHLPPIRLPAPGTHGQDEPPRHQLLSPLQQQRNKSLRETHSVHDPTKKQWQM